MQYSFIKSTRCDWPITMVFLAGLLVSCGNRDDAEAKKLGFADKNEMYEIQSRGYQTKAKFLEMESKAALRAKPLSEGAP